MKYNLKTSCRSISSFKARSGVFYLVEQSMTTINSQFIGCIVMKINDSLIVLFSKDSYDIGLKLTDEHQLLKLSHGDSLTVKF